MFEMTEPQLLEPFIKAVQYMVGMKSEQDIRNHLGKFVSTYFPAEWTAFIERDAVNGISVHHCSLPEAARDGFLTDEVRISINDVLDSGFLTSEVILTPAPSMTVFLPLVEESQVKGVMLIGHDSTDPIPNELLNIYLAIASLGSTTFELNGHRAHLEELVEDRTSALKQTNEQLELEIAERKLAESELHDERERLAITLGSIGDGVIATDTDGNITLLNGVAQELTGWTLAQAQGRPLLEVFNIIDETNGKPAENPVAKALKTGQIVGLANHTALIARDGSVRSIADSCAPIRSQDGQIIGAVLVFRDVTGERQVEDLNHALNRIHVAIGSTLDFDEIMQRVVVESAKALEVETAAVELLEESGWPVRYVFGLPQDAIGAPLTGNDGMITRLLKQEGWQVVVGDERDERIDWEALARFDIYSFLAVPLTVREEAVGAIIFYRSQHVPFTEAQVDFARKLGASVSLALENARLYAAERHIAQTLQEALLITPRELPGIKFGHLYSSATEAAKVGGDFYDVFEIDDEKIGIVIGDVSGKGVSAATLTVVVENTIKAFAHQGLTPAEVLDKTNDIIMREARDGRFVTVFFCILNTRTGALSYCTGGHPPALLKRSSGGIERLRKPSPLIGAFAGLSYCGAEVQLEAGDVLVLYTDGTVEARDADGGLFGELRLIETIGAPHGAEEMPHHIFDAINRFTGGRLTDDIALLAVSLRQHV